MTRALFAECESMGIPVLPAFSVTRDHTRSRCSHQINVEELRELILALILDKPTSRYFDLENKGAIRHVMCLHLTDCDAAPAEVREAVSDPVALRVSRSVSEGCFLPRHLSEAKEATETSPSAHSGGLAQYIHNEATLRTWFYPLPISEGSLGSSEASTVMTITEEARATDGSPLEAELNGESDHEPDLKRVKLDREDYNAVKGSHGWAVSDAATSTRLLKEVPLVSVLEPPGVVNNGFRETLSCTSSEYQMLFSSAGITHGTMGELPLLHMVSVDCEMCDTRRGLELTRVSLTDQCGSIVLDMFVKPRDPITNYRSQFSGITPEIMESVQHTFEEAQLAVLRLVPQETTLVGHSLDSDLRALRLSHRRCIDTTVLFPHPRSFPFRNKLRYLAMKYLNINVQTGNAGHDSVEDARTAMRLVHLKVERGPSFGVPKELSRVPLLSGLGDHCDAYFAWSNEECWKSMNSCVPEFGKVSDFKLIML